MRLITAFALLAVYRLAILLNGRPWVAAATTVEATATVADIMADAESMAAAHLVILAASSAAARAALLAGSTAARRVDFTVAAVGSTVVAVTAK